MLHVFLSVSKDQRLLKGGGLFQNQRLCRLSELRSKAKRLNLHSVMTIQHYPTDHAFAITQAIFL